MEYELGSDEPVAPLSVGYTVFSSLMLVLLAYVAQNSVRRLRKGKTWATFFMARLGVFSFISR
jgi:hypothetical protein